MSDVIYISYFMMGVVSDFSTLAERYFFADYFSITFLPLVTLISNSAWALQPFIAGSMELKHRNMVVAGIYSCAFYGLAAWCYFERVHVLQMLLVMCLAEFGLVSLYVLLDGMTSKTGGVNVFKCYRYRMLGSVVGNIMGSRIYLETNLGVVFLVQVMLLMWPSVSTRYMRDYTVVREDTALAHQPNITRFALMMCLFSVFPTSFAVMDYFAISALRIEIDTQSYMDMVAGFIGAMGAHDGYVKHVFMINSACVFCAQFVVFVLLDRMLISKYDPTLIIAKNALVRFAQASFESYVMDMAFDKYKGDAKHISMMNMVATYSPVVGVLISSACIHYFEIDHDNFQYASQYALVCLCLSILPVFGCVLIRSS